MKRPSIFKLFIATVVTFVVTFGAGFGAGTALLVEGSRGESLAAYLTRPRSLSVGSGTGAQKTVQRKKTVRRSRGVVRRLIVRPTTMRRSASSTATGSQASSSAGRIKASCGDGLVLMSEQCDDKNLTAGDGCASNCTVEGGFVCNSAQPSLCWSVCGDSVIASNEKCDDGGKVGGDGCSATCKTEMGYTCTGSPSVCEITPYCGDSIKASTEQCDDGNGIPGDGCHLCKTE